MPRRSSVLPDNPVQTHVLGPLCVGALPPGAAFADRASEQAAGPCAAPAELASHSISQQIGGCGLAVGARLLTGAPIEARRLSTGNEATHYDIRLRTTRGWSIRRTHLAVATSLGSIPTAGPGNPVPGHFAHQQTPARAVTE